MVGSVPSRIGRFHEPTWRRASWRHWSTLRRSCAVSSGPIYLDHAATTFPRSHVVAAVEDAWRVANPSSTHRPGRQAYEMLDEARLQVARTLDVDKSEIVFCSSATEANNLALFGVLSALAARGTRRLLHSAIEHPSVLEPARELARRGVSVGSLSVDETGTLDLGAFDATLDGGAELVSVMLVNNEVGVIQPVGDAARMARERGALVHTDAVQAMLACDVRPHQLGVDLLTLSGHKIGGPRGVGMLFVRGGVQLSPVLYGGGQEGGRRAGTEDVAAAVGFAVALQLAIQEREEQRRRMTGLRARFVDRLRDGIPGVVELGGANVSPHIVSCAMPGVPADALKVRLDAAGLAASSGSACSGRHVEASHVAVAMGVPKGLQRSVVRWSFGHDSCEAEVSRAAEIVVEAWRAMTARDGLRPHASE
ncbi:MAG: cysteine desulfurase [Myxococcales bacterium FL481]|nr:MAG: cysteine desulfurase [Myxococcales bacterium FL481]